MCVRVCICAGVAVVWVCVCGGRAAGGVDGKCWSERADGAGGLANVSCATAVGSAAGKRAARGRGVDCERASEWVWNWSRMRGRSRTGRGLLWARRGRGRGRGRGVQEQRREQEQGVWGGESARAGTGRPWRAQRLVAGVAVCSGRRRWRALGVGVGVGVAEQPGVVVRPCLLVMALGPLWYRRCDSQASRRCHVLAPASLLERSRASDSIMQVVVAMLRHDTRDAMHDEG